MKKTGMFLFTLLMMFVLFAACMTSAYADSDFEYEFETEECFFRV